MNTLIHIATLLLLLGFTLKLFSEPDLGMVAFGVLALTLLVLALTGLAIAHDLDHIRGRRGRDD